jgi:hypothetical protein
MIVTTVRNKLEEVVSELMGMYASRSLDGTVRAIELDIEIHTPNYTYQCILGLLFGAEDFLLISTLQLIPFL